MYKCYSNRFHREAQWDILMTYKTHCLINITLPVSNKKRNMAARMEISRRALERGRAIIITDDEQSFICGECPARIPCFNKPRTKPTF